MHPVADLQALIYTIAAKDWLGKNSITELSNSSAHIDHLKNSHN